MSCPNTYGRVRRLHKLPLFLPLLTLLLGALVAVAALPPLDVAHDPQPGQPAVNAAVGRTSAGQWLLIEASGDIGKGTGSVRRRSLSLTAAGVPSGGDVLWDADIRLTGHSNGAAPVAPLPLPEDRLIYTFDGPLGRAGTVPFQWAMLSDTARAHLDRAQGAGHETDVADGRGEARLAWIRGERSGEGDVKGASLRKRTGILGDIVHSTPLIVGPPAAFGFDSDVAQFRAQYSDRPSAVYVGANDGMLHAFDTASGDELFAYIPGALLADIGALASPGYRARPFVDASAGQGDARVGGAWRSVLASGMGMGARGMFALDITDPRQFSAGRGALWEFTESDDKGIGFVRAAPIIASVAIGNARVPTQRYVAIVSSGFNSLAPDGRGVLFLLALDKAASERWQPGHNYFAIPTGDAVQTMSNALSAPALVLGVDGNAAYAYAGDLQGNLWRFDLALLTAQRIFTAYDATGRRQPIAHPPKIVFAPGGGYLVVFGTGKLIEPDDWKHSSFSSQSMYAILDRPDTKGEAGSVPTRAELVERSVTGKDKLTVSGAPVDYFAEAPQRGWYFDFPHSSSDGERALGVPTLASGAILFETVQPGAGASAVTRLYVIEAISGLAFDGNGVARTGQQTGSAVRDGAMLSSLVVPVSALAGHSDPTGGAIVSRTFAVLRPNGQSVAEGARQVQVRQRARRLGWREVANWHELHRAVKP